MDRIFLAAGKAAKIREASYVRNEDALKSYYSLTLDEAINQIAEEFSLDERDVFVVGLLLYEAWNETHDILVEMEKSTPKPKTAAARELIVLSDKAQTIRVSSGSDLMQAVNAVCVGYENGTAFIVGTLLSAAPAETLTLARIYNNG